MQRFEFKILLVGDPQVGKTSWLTRLRTGNYWDEYKPTQGVAVHPINIQTNYGQITFNIWDCAGQPHLQGLRDGYYIGADAIIIMSDATKGLNKSNQQLRADIERVLISHVPVVCVVNKVDRQSLFRSALRQHRPKWLRPGPIIGVSARTNHNLARPLQSLGCKLMGVSDLEILPDEPIFPMLVNEEEQESNLSKREIEDYSATRGVISTFIGMRPLLAQASKL